MIRVGRKNYGVWQHKQKQMLSFHKSNRLENLVSQLSDKVLSTPLSSPFMGEQIVVETHGLAQWLKLELARREGIVANVEFPFPRAFISNLILNCVEIKPGEKLIEPEALTWRIMGKLPALAKNCATDFPEIHSYLTGAPGQAADPRRNFQLADRLASLFDQYSVFRPKIVEAWIENRPVAGGADVKWQSQLWRQTMTDGLACQGRYLFELINALKNSNCPVKSSLERLTVFCPRSLPPIYLEVLKNLSERIPVHVFCLCPSEYYWGDIVTPREKGKIFALAKRQKLPIDNEKLLLDGIHPLLSSWGKTGRNFQRLLADTQEEGGAEAALFTPPAKTSLLARIQSSIYELDDLASQTEAGRVEIAADDGSIQIHSCHSQLREIQVLRDQILSWFDRDKSLSPQDILVMAPDIDAYAPFIKGIFGDAEPGAPAIPFTQAERGVRQDSPLADAFVSFLQMASGRFSASELIGLFETPAVHRRFRVDEAELDQIRLWVGSAAIRWGRDGQQRKSLGLPDYSDYSWENGCDRLVLGYALADSADELFAGVLPCSGIEGTATDLLGRWLDFLRTFFNSVDRLSGQRQLKDWAGTLNTILDVLFLSDHKEERALQFIRSQLDALRRQQEISGFDSEIPLGVVLERIVPKLQEAQPGKALLRGAVTFSGLKAMRGIPFKIICLLGMQDEAFPRNPVPPSFDLIAQKPEAGDESCRDDDRFLFLESLLACRERFYVSYIGQSIKDNSARPPSVVVCELVDFITHRFRLLGGPDEAEMLGDELVTTHRLHAFSPAYFLETNEKSRRLFSYSPALAKVGALISDPEQREKLAPFYIADPAKISPPPKTVQLKDLQSFFQNPSRYFLKHCLQIRFPEERETLAEEEPFALDALARYQCKEQVIKARLAGKSINLSNQWRGAGTLPPGMLGSMTAKSLRAEANQIIEAYDAIVAGKPLKRQGFQLKIGEQLLEGELKYFEGLGIVHCRAGDVDPQRKPKPNLDLWLEHLVWQSMEGGSRISKIIGKDGLWSYQPVDDPTKILAELLAFHHEGSAGPLPFFPQTSFAYAWEPDETKKDDKATEAWEGNEYTYTTGDSEDAYVDLCFRNAGDVFGDKFKATALAVAKPLEAHQQQEPAV